jgi:Thiamine pyrophosphate enzyme, C-terminal TPP binding domain
MAATAHNAKVMNRFELTKRLVAHLKREEAVIGGIGNANFDLWMSGQRPQNFYMLGSMGLTIPIAFGVALAQPQRHVVALEGDGSLLMQLGCLSTIAMQSSKNLKMGRLGQRHVPDHRRPADGERRRDRSRHRRARLRASEQLFGQPTKTNSTDCSQRR